MKIRITYLIILLFLVVAACQNTATVPKPKTFKPPRTADQMLVWLKEHNCEVEKPGGNHYSISWKEELPHGQITGIIRSRDFCDVLIESEDGKNTVYFTFTFSLGDSTDVIVLSKSEYVELKPPDYLPVHHPMHIYTYHLRNLQTSEKPVTTFQIYFSRALITGWGDVDVDPLVIVNKGLDKLTHIEIGYISTPLHLSSMFADKKVSGVSALTKNSGVFRLSGSLGN